jgi:hypothetical protein
MIHQKRNMDLKEIVGYMTLGLVPRMKTMVLYYESITQIRMSVWKIQNAGKENVLNRVQRPRGRKKKDM